MLPHRGYSSSLRQIDGSFARDEQKIEEFARVEKIGKKTEQLGVETSAILIGAVYTE